MKKQNTLPGTMQSVPSEQNPAPVSSSSQRRMQPLAREHEQVCHDGGSPASPSCGAQSPVGLRLTNDLVFKTLFARQLHLLSDLVNAVLQWAMPITVVKVLNPDILPSHMAGKRIILDILARDESGALFIIEMQVRREDPWPERNVYYLARGLSEQMLSGQDYDAMRPVIGISLLAHDLFPDQTEQALWRLSLCDERTPSVGFKDALQLHIIELPKAERLGGLPPALSAWITCLLHNLDEAIMNQITHPPVQEALHRLHELSADERLRWEALQREIALLDERTALKRATQKGVALGREEGKEEGREEERETNRQAAVYTLRQLLQGKFGAVPQWAQERIATADLCMLQRWTRHILDADRIEILFSTGA